MGEGYIVKTENLYRASDSVEPIINKLNTVSNNLRASTTTASLLMPNEPQYKERLKLVRNSILEEAAKMKSLQSALRYIADRYEVAEDNVTSNFTGTSRQIGGTDKRGVLHKLWDKLFHKDPDKRNDITSREREMAVDAAMMEQIDIINNRARYSEQVWKTANTDERKQILIDYMNEVAALFGLDFVKNTINFTNTPPSKGVINQGSYNPSTGTISINEYVLNNYSASYSYQDMAGIIHLLRFAYQADAIAHPTQYVVSQETIDSWKQGFTELQQLQEEWRNGEILTEEYWRRYYSNAVQEDAGRFAKEERYQRHGK